MDIIIKARQWCNTVRTKPTPLSEAIPMVQALCDEVESLRANLAQPTNQEANFKNDNLVNALIFYSKFSDSRISEVAKIALAMKESK